jgi:hypothetical protein
MLLRRSRDLEGSKTWSTVLARRDNVLRDRRLSLHLMVIAHGERMYQPLQLRYFYLRAMGLVSAFNASGENIRLSEGKWQQ